MTPNEIFESALVHDIMLQKNRRLFKLLGAFVPSGQMIFTLNQIEEDIEVETSYNN